MLFQNRLHIGPDTYIPVKLVATRDRQVITDVIKATNRQTAVLPEALESLTPFHKELEDFYTIQESSRDASERLFYERRSKQYAIDNVDQRNIVTLTNQIRAFIGMFLNEPHSHPRYYGELLRSYEGRLFANDHKPAPYYAGGVALLIVERWLNTRPAERYLRFYKHQLLMLLRASISGPDIPRLNSDAITSYSLRIVGVLRDPKRSNEECLRVAEIVKTALAKSDARAKQRSGAYHGNPPHRLKAFTEELISAFPSSKAVLERRKSGDRALPGGAERGRIIWYDEGKNYGFIERDSGGDIFVHQGEISAIPWHLRIADRRVQYEVVKNPRSAGMLMARRVSLETSGDNGVAGSE